ncbi:MAG: class I SAM-dependent methyltransferase [Aeromonas sp.]
MPSIAYYQTHAAEFAQGTLSVDMAPLYARFLPHLVQGAHIIDAGCGAGRDSRAFLAQGFTVTAFDASAALVAIAREQTGLAVQCCRFDEFQTTSPADALWACASLLHVPAADLPRTLAHLSAQLVPNGLLYCSFKYGQGEVQRGGRSFTQLDEAGLAALMAPLPLAAIEVWVTVDQRPDRAGEAWLNAVLRYQP